MRHLLSLREYSKDEISLILDLAFKMKSHKEEFYNSLRNKTLAMLFQKTSTRTRCSFEAGMTQLGGHAIFLDWRTTNFTLGSLQDEIKCLARYADIIMARVYKHEDVKAMAEASRVPVINGLCDLYHPCQILADLMTVKEYKKDFKGLKLAFIGDGNNVCNTLIIGCTKMGMKVSVATPKGYEPLAELVKEFKPELTNDPKEAAKDADIIYTDTWVSMGQEGEHEARTKAFKGYQVNKTLLGKALFMHCLPAHRGYEVSDDVLDSKQSVVYDQAENRMHAQKALMVWLLRK